MSRPKAQEPLTGRRQGVTEDTEAWRLRGPWLGTCLGGRPLSERSNLSGIPSIHKVRICNISD